MESSQFRRILGHWASGVAVVATKAADGTACGLTANAITSVSLEPPLILVCIDKNADTHGCIRAAGYFAVSVMNSSNELIARRFSAWEVSTKFDSLLFHTEATGAPILDDALAWLDCRVWAEHDGGDHTVFIGQVLAGNANEGIPLVYYRGGYGRFLA